MEKQTSDVGFSFELIFGILFAGLPVAGLFVNAFVESGNPSGANDFMETAACIGIFFLVGSLLAVNAFSKLKIDWATKKKGFIGYGQVVSIEYTGVKINNKPQLAATVRTYIPQLNVVVNLSEVVGVGESPYEIDSIVAVRYWDFDINILYGVEDTFSLPQKVQEVLLGRAVIKEEKNENSWDNVNTENWTLTEEAFPEDMELNRQEDSAMTYSDDDPPTVLRKPVRTRADEVDMWFKRILRSVVVYSILVSIAVVIRFK